MKIGIRVFLLSVILVLSCHTKSFSSQNETHQIDEIVEIEVFTPEHNTISFVAVGDNLFHCSIINTSFVNGVYDFSPIFSEVIDIVQGADLAFINQETVMAGTSFGYTGFPLFNTPQSLAQTLADTGFHIVNLANNHAMDKRAAGLLNTLDLLDTIEGLTVIGARKEGESARIITKNDITLGFLAYTHSLNGIPLPRDNPNLVSVINREVMAREIIALRPLCDFLIVSIHWGAEYRLQPGRDQIELANFLAEHEVDLVIGHHPHVLQRVETITAPSGRETVVFYSLGNFVSHQLEKENLIGGMMVLTFSKEITMSKSREVITELTITGIGMIPLITHYDRRFRNTKVYPLHLYTEELLASHGFWRYDSRRVDPAGFTMGFFNSVMDRVQTKVITENPFAPAPIDTN
ncbi:MAG: CapA family protein [Treponema sp.]|jgi:poly-gamma-glutamate synthesis protein (capsule biosynthesis protein)|nr:CapA family protein [Treponema sp.]